MVFAREIDTRLQPYFGHRSATRLVLSARALRCPPAAFGEGSRWKALRTMLSQFASREVPDVAVKLTAKRSDGEAISARATTDAEGFVHFDIALDPAWPLPASPAWEIVTLQWENDSGAQDMEGFVLAPGQSIDLAVISDIDDTVIETGITGDPRNIARNWKRVIAQLPHERIAVPDADAFYGELGGGMNGKHGDRMRATRRPFFYISSSPWNLFSYLVAFKRLKGLPLGPVALRDWGFNRQTLGKSSHGAHKREAIARILDMHPQLRFAMIGDDTQGDLPAFAHAAATHPGRIAAVFLRRAADEPFSDKEIAAKQILQAQNVPLWLGETFATGVEFLRELGFSEGGETEQIVRVVEHVDTAKEERAKASDTQAKA